MMVMKKNRSDAEAVAAAAAALVVVPRMNRWKDGNPRNTPSLKKNRIIINTVVVEMPRRLNEKHPPREREEESNRAEGRGTDDEK